MKKIILGELFSGPGGIAIGAELANQTISKFSDTKFVHGWAVDYHDETVSTYRRNVEGATDKTAIVSDVRKITAKQLAKISKIDGFAYGFPCNDFSLVGEHKGIDGDFGPLYSYGLPILDEFNPKFFIAENVGGIRSANEGKTLLKILDDLSNAGKGYVITPHLYKFEEYGVPQARHRVIMVGIRKDLKLTFKPPAPTHLKKFKTCKEAIEKPPINSAAHNHDLTKQHPRVVARLKYIKPGENAWTANLPDDLKLNVTGAQISQIYKRLDPDKPAYTITGSGGGGTHVYHWVENRALTNRERARLQTFPDDFIFEGNKEAIRRQIGMAVPPLGAKIIFEAIIKTLEGVEYKSVKQNIE
uniref:DNA cytosine methyltransferase n=1 Tax=Polynucleobacter sp. TaxID=2029855 RepID=UPI0040473983